MDDSRPEAPKIVIKLFLSVNITSRLIPALDLKFFQLRYEKQS